MHVPGTNVRHPSDSNVPGADARRGCAALVVAALVACGGARLVSAKEHTEPPTPALAYPLDAESRTLGPNEPLPCGRHPLVAYRGERIKYSTTARVHPAMVEKLRQLEALVTELSIAHYGRAPRRLVHLGTHNCRRIRTYPDWISEHTFGNAIDLAGFDFGPLPRTTSANAANVPGGLPRALRGAFKVRLLDHWTGRGATNAYHSRFLRELATRLIDRRDMFRGILGPAWPGHRNHFHLDMAPYRVVEVFEENSPR